MDEGDEEREGKKSNAVGPDGTIKKQDGLLPGHCTLMPNMCMMKQDHGKDVNLFFTDQKLTKFVYKNGKEETLTGRWCLECL